MVVEGDWRDWRDWNKWLRGHIDEVLVEIGIEKNQRVLDFGCGSGAYASPAATLVGRGGKVYALDIDAGALQTLEETARKQGLGNVETICSSSLETDLPDDAVDVVLLYDVIHLIKDRAKLLAEIRRILRSDGFVSLYPMHVVREEVLIQMQMSGFVLSTEKYQGNILHFGT